jgi:TDG/mug DNA glycosylase family protein
VFSANLISGSTSGLAASLKQVEKERIWRELGMWVEARRAKRGLSEALKSEAEPPLKIEEV